MGPLNPSDPEAFRAFQERWKAKAERGYANELARLIARVGKEAAQAAEQGLDPLAGPEVERHAAELRAAMVRRNRQIGEAWGGLVRRDAKSAWAHERKGFEEDFGLWLERFLTSVTASKVIGIAQTTRDEIRRAIEQGQREELGSRQTARLIRERTRVIGASRALTIARTEAGQVSNAATGAAADNLDIDYRREWSAAASERTRTAHRNADGQMRGRDEAFDVGGEKLMHPGDPQGSAGNVINCRCAVALRTE